MDILHDKISKLYSKYLLAAFGSALISCIYGLVDMAMVGQYYGPIGSQAMAVIAPIWNIIYSLGLLVGIGGSVLFSYFKGKEEKDKGNLHFSTSIILGIIISIILWLAIWVFEDNLLFFFGARNEQIMTLCKEYLLPIKFIVPSFVFSQILAAFLRNDDNPLLATIAVLCGGIFNVFGDYFFVFPLNMGMEGAGLATALGSVISVLIMLTHFFSKKNTLKFSFNKDIKNCILPIAQNGFSTFIVDVAMGFLTIIFNNLILLYLSDNDLAVYAVIVNVSTIVQCSAYGIGQAGQPIISSNFGAKNDERVKKMLKLNIITSFVLGLICTLIVIAIPNLIIKVFMSPTEEVLSIAPRIMRIYAISFILLPYNVYATYYFQAILKEKVSIVISLARGIVLSGIILVLLPLVFGGNAIWWTMPITELIVAIYVTIKIAKTLAKQ